MNGTQHTEHRLSRRDFLRGTGVGAFLWFARSPLVSAVDELQSVIADQVGSRNIGVDVARFMRAENRVSEIYRVGVNQDALRPTASCFKTWVLMYYYTFVAPEDWDDSPGTDPYNIVVNSHNTAVGRVLQDVGKYQSYGNDIEKFNDFLIYGLDLEHGVNEWGWDGNPVQGIYDDRFQPGGERRVRSRGELHAIGNLTTAADTLNGYRSLYQRSFAADADIFGANKRVRRLGALNTLRLLSLPSDDPNYNSPVERAVGRGVYAGKDGVLPEVDTTAGRVINDAGLIPMSEGMLAVSFFAVSESEFTVVNIIREIVRAMYRVEQSLLL
jgi:hypothetical protein